MSEPSNCLVHSGTAYCIGALPKRKRIALFRHEETAIEPVAYFQSAEAAERFREWFIGLGKLAQGEEAA